MGLEKSESGEGPKQGLSAGCVAETMTELANEPISSKTVLTAGLLRVENPRSGLVSAADVVNLSRA
jgi:hypothetical protein